MHVLRRGRLDELPDSGQEAKELWCKSINILGTSQNPPLVMFGDLRHALPTEVLVPNQTRNPICILNCIPGAAGGRDLRRRRSHLLTHAIPLIEKCP